MATTWQKREGKKSHKSYATRFIYNGTKMPRFGDQPPVSKIPSAFSSLSIPPVSVLHFTTPPPLPSLPSTTSKKGKGKGKKSKTQGRESEQQTGESVEMQNLASSPLPSPPSGSAVAGPSAGPAPFTTAISNANYESFTSFDSISLGETDPMLNVTNCSRCSQRLAPSWQIVLLTSLMALLHATAALYFGLMFW